MANFVTPVVHIIGYTHGDLDAIIQYLKETDQTDFIDDINEAKDTELTTGEIIISLFAKLCYKSLVVGKNANVQKTRSVRKNIEGCFDTGHGSVFEHMSINFLITNCSRVFTHELVRHRVGTAFSQTSGRYCRLDNIDLVLDPILEPVGDIFKKHLEKTEIAVYLAECKLGLRKPPASDPDAPPNRCLTTDENEFGGFTRSKWVPDDTFDFERRKKITSAIRRIAPNGQSNEIGFTCNVNAIRHILMLRTAKHAEWEIRLVFNQVYHAIMSRWPLLLHGHKTRDHEGLLEIYSMKKNPYEETPK